MEDESRLLSQRRQKIEAHREAGQNPYANHFRLDPGEMAKARSRFVLFAVLNVISYGLLSGMLAGIGTQPATLGFAREQADNDLPSVGYASVYPIATIAKIVLAQLILLLSR